MKTFSEIQSQIDEALRRDILTLVENGDTLGGEREEGFGRGGYEDPHHLSGHGQLLDVLIRKLSQLGVENDDIAREVAEKLGLDLPEDGGVQALLKMLKCHGLGTEGPGHFDHDTEEAKREVLQVASKMVAGDMEQVRERPLAPEGSELTRAPVAARTPPNQTTGLPGDPLGYANQGNLDITEESIRESFREIERALFSEGITPAKFARQKTANHVKLFSGKVEAYTRKDGLWTNYDSVKVPTVYTVDVWWNPEDMAFGDFDFAMLDVHVKSPRYDGFGKSGLIYTDGAFEANVIKLAKQNGYRGGLQYTEQGMQGQDWVSMDTGRAFSRELRKRFPDVFKRFRAMQKESLELQEDKTDRELKKGLGQWIQDAQAARRFGNSRLETQIQRNIMQVVVQKGLDAQRIMTLLGEGVDVGFEARLSLNEDITPILRNIVDRKTAAQVKFDNGKRLTVDLFSAGALIAVHDALSKEAQEKFRRMASKNDFEFRKILSFALKHVG